jgi:CubicO group peptidase (beta-lactamase class C family)
MKTIFTVIFLILINSAFSQDRNIYQYKLEQIDSVLINKIGLKEPGLSLSITLDNQVIFEKYYGYADITENEKLTSQHVLGIASMSKQFTGMATLFLVEEGKLSLDDNIKDYMPDLPIGNRKIMIRQLLSHTCGLPEITRNDKFMNKIAQRHTPQEIIDIAFLEDFTGEPGVKWQYCNTGYIIMASLIEKLSGQRFSEYLQEKIFTPLKMNNTYACDYNQDAYNAVPRYFADSSGYINATEMDFSNLIGGGSIISNVKDMAKWGIALISGDKLPSNYREIWKSNLLNSGEQTGYGLGLGVNVYKDKSYYYHPGMGDGMNSVNLIFPEDKITINVIRNISKPKLKSMEVALMVTEYLFFK